MSFGKEAAARLANKTILITGASAGIGQQTAIDYAEAANGQIKLVVTARRLEKLEELKTQLETQYPQIKVYIAQVDVSKVADIHKFFDELPKEFSEIDILVNNAGKAQGVDVVGEISELDIQTVLQTNVVGMITVTQHVIKGMKERNRGDIVQLGSIAGRVAYEKGSLYNASKFALRGFTDALRKELINTKIRVIEIAPGNVETEFSKVRFYGDEAKAAKVYEGTEPLYAKDISDLIVFTTTRRENTVIADTLIFATNQASPFHIYRNTN